MIDLLGQFLRITPGFRGRGRLTNYWLQRKRSSSVRLRQLPGGTVVECDVSIPYEAMIWLGCEEQQDLALLRQLLRPGEVFVDCGANIGLWSLVAASAVGPTGRIYAFEPNPFTHRRLKHHIQRNGYADRITAFECACGDEVGESSLLCSKVHNVSRIGAKTEANAVTVPIARLDALLPDKKIDGLKIDVEGHELQVLHGAQRILRRDRPWLCVEFNADFVPSRVLGDWDVHHYLTKEGYRCRQFVTGPGSPQLNENWTVDWYTNLFYSFQ